MSVNQRNFKKKINSIKTENPKDKGKFKIINKDMKTKLMIKNN